MASSSWPPAPLDTLDWANIGFKVREVNGHIESRYSVKTGKWSKPEFVRDPYLRIHGFAPGLNYGMQAFEGLKAFRNPEEKITIFRADRNAARQNHSNSVVSMPEIPTEHFVDCVHLAVGLNAEHVPPHRTGAAMYIRPLTFGSSAQLGLNPPEEFTFVVYVLPTGVYHGTKAVDGLILEDFDRAAPDGTGHAKLGGNYAPVLRFSQRAYDENFGITLHLDSRTRSEIDEFSTAGFLGVHNKGGQFTIVVPDSHSVIDSVTSRSIREIASSFGWTVERRRIPYEELKEFDEVLAAGTAAALVPLRSITMRSKNDKFTYLPSTEPGEACIKLLSTLRGIQSGTVPDTMGWNAEVKAPNPATYSARDSSAEAGDVHGSNPKSVNELQSL